MSRQPLLPPPRQPTVAPNATRLTRSTPRWILVIIASSIILLILLTPLVVLVGYSLPALLTGSWQSSVVVDALQLSLFTATITTGLAILIGTPLAYLLARYQFVGSTLLDVLIDLPMVLPPTVAGVALLVAFGRNGLIGQILLPFGIQLPFSVAAVILAQTFVAAPFYIRAAKAGFMDVDPMLEQISLTLGESQSGTFWRVTLPLARNALLSGAVMTWARALGEFGATLIFAGNAPGRTQTMPLAIYTAYQSELTIALTLATLLLLTSAGILTVLRWVTS